MAIGWAFIGTGRYPDRIGAPGAALADDTELIATYSRDRGRAEAFASKHGFQAAYDSVEELLADSRVDAVFMATPNNLHATHTRMAGEAGKHVLTEKPMALTVDDGIDMVRTCKSHDVKLGVGFQLRCHPGHMEASRLVQQGVLGTVVLTQAQLGNGERGQLSRATRSEPLSQWWQQPEMIGGAATMIGAGIHAIDDMHFLLGQNVVEIAAITDGQNSESALEGIATMCLRFDGGAIGMMVCSSKIPDSKNDVVIYGSDGRIVLKDAARPSMGGEFEVVSETVNNTIAYEPDPLLLFKWQTEAFNRAILNDEEPAASGIDGLKIIQVTLAMIESASTGRTVKIDPLPAF